MADDRVLEPRLEKRPERSTQHQLPDLQVTLGIHVFVRTALAFRMGIGAISVPNDFGMIELGEDFVGEGGSSFLIEVWMHFGNILDGGRL